MDTIRAKIHTWESIVATLDTWQVKKETLVFTNGCFDIIHQGHIHNLSYAAGQGTKLIVGLNSDASVRRLKGSSRPVQDEASRSLVMAALGFVDAVVIFDQDTPFDLIQLVQPDVLVKGGDYKTKQEVVGWDIVEAKGGKVVLVPYLEGFSTTNILSKV